MPQHVLIALPAHGSPLVGSNDAPKMFLCYIYGQHTLWPNWTIKLKSQITLNNNFGTSENLISQKLNANLTYSTSMLLSARVFNFSLVTKRDGLARL